MFNRYAVAIIPIILLGACKPVDALWNEISAKGTVRGVETCMEQKASDLVAEATVRRSCIQEFEVSIPTLSLASLDGRGRIETQYEDTVFKVNYTHKIDDWILTRVRIEIYVKEDDVGETEIIQRMNSETAVWVEPHVDFPPSFEHELVDAPDKLEKLPWCGDEVEEKCLSWTIIDAKGLKI